jgi:uncharacterized protein YcbK (DUF882 family)
MLRLLIFGVAFSLALAAGPQVRAQEASEPSGSSPAAPDQAQSAQAQSGGDDGAESPADAMPTHAKKRRSRRSHRHPVVSGHVVSEESLRQGPLPHPSGRLHLIFPGVKDEVDVNIYNEDGSYNISALEQASHLLRCRRTDTERPIDPQLLMLLSHVADHFAKPLEIVSGYRNQRKQTSNHYKGAAADIRIAGVPAKKVREFAETLDGGGMGIGFYPRGQFVHIDVRSPPSYRWIDYSPPNSNAAEKRPPRGWKRKKLQS